jgi:hypothetical protein
VARHVLKCRSNVSRVAEVRVDQRKVLVSWPRDRTTCIVASSGIVWWPLGMESDSVMYRSSTGQGRSISQSWSLIKTGLPISRASNLIGEYYAHKGDIQRSNETYLSQVYNPHHSRFRISLSTAVQGPDSICSPISWATRTAEPIHTQLADLELIS